MPRKALLGFDRFENVDSALKKLLSSVKLSVGSELVNISEAVGRVAAEDVLAPYDYPPFNRAAVDGFAVRSEDTSGASPSNPVMLRKSSMVIEASEQLAKLPTLKEGEAILAFTGAPLPYGANAVVPVENVVIEKDVVYVLRSVPPLGNVSKAGEDFKKGEILVRAGTKLRPWHIAALAQANIPRVKVFRRFRVGIVSTGSELSEVGSRGYIVDSTSFMASSYVAELGGEPIRLGLVPDDVNTIREAVAKALKVSDVVVVTGGSSVGGKDLVPEAIYGLGDSKLLFHGVNLRPGRTAGAFVVKGKLVLMLSGLPVACLVGLEVFLRPLVKKSLGIPEELRPRVKGVLTRRIANAVGFRSFFRVVVFKGKDGRIYVEPLRLTGSGIVSTLLKGNGVLIISEDVEGFDEGAEVEVELINPLYRERPAFLRWV
ncbi:MAG: molybdopterin molybdenumtransferase MoeA [Desulfurococcales archaeon ex4484_204]|nr:MAG: molybdopterin molybdenumtransferase MoeA [Desulfurococcales archaeon ex4484_204]